MNADPQELATENSDRQTNTTIYLLMLVMLTLSCLPYAWGQAFTEPGFVYSGTAFNIEDDHSYLAKMLQGYDGQWRYVNRYTTETYRETLLFEFYLLCGHIARWIHISIPLMYHVARVLCGLFLLIQIDRLIRACGFKSRTRIIAFGLATFGTGLGVFTRVMEIDINPPELWWSEAYVFQSIIRYPHFALGTGLITGMFADMLLLGSDPNSATRTKQFHYASIIMQAFLLAWVHPRLLLTVLLVSSFAGLIGWRRGHWPLWHWFFGGLAILIAGSIPAALIMMSYRGDPIWEHWSHIGMPTPGYLRFFFTYGLMWPMAIAGAIAACKRGEPWGNLLLCWLVIGAILPYLPIATAHRLVQGMNIPVAILAGSYMGGLLKPNLSVLKNLASLRVAAIFGLTWSIIFLTIIVILLHGMLPFMRPSYPWYYSQARYDALIWLRENTKRDDVVLCGTTSGLVIPAVAGNRVFVGHWAETHLHEDKLKLVQDYLNGKLTSEETALFLENHRIRYLLWSGRERDLGPFHPGTVPDLWKPVWEKEGIWICERIR